MANKTVEMAAFEKKKECRYISLFFGQVFTCLHKIITCNCLKVIHTGTCLGESGLSDVIIPTNAIPLLHPYQKSCIQAVITTLRNLQIFNISPLHGQLFITSCASNSMLLPMSPVCAQGRKTFLSRVHSQRFHSDVISVSRQFQCYF